MTTDRATALLERAERDPENVSATALVDLVSTPAVDEERVAAALRSVLEADPDAADAAMAALADFAAAEDMLVRDAKVRLVAAVAAVDPERVAPFVDDLLELLTDEFDVAHANALLALARLAEVQSEALADAAPVVGPLVDGDEPLVQARAVAFLSTLADHRPSAVEPAVPSLVSLLAARRDGDAVLTDEVPDTIRAERDAARRDREQLRESAADLLVSVAEDVAPAVEETVPTLREVAATDANLVVRRAACHLLWVVAGESPDAAMPAAPALGDVLADVSGETALERSTGATAARALALLADRDRSALADVEPAVETLFALLAADEAEARAAAAGLLSYVAETDPAAVAARPDALLAGLGDDHPPVRAGVAFALGAAGVRRGVERLRRVRETDPDESVRTAAGAALERLDDQ